MTIPKRIAGAVGATALAVALGAGCAWASPAQAGAPDLAAQTRAAQALSAQAQPLASFPDVQQGSWYYDSVHGAVEKGLFSGYDDGRFGPDDQLTRAQLAAVMWNHYEPEASAAYDGQAKNTTGLPDVKDNQWYTAAVNWAIDDGALSGYDNGTFGPDNAVTREQACAIIANCSHKHHGSDIEGADTSKLDAMPDASSVSGWARQSVAWVLNEEVASGKEVGSQRYMAPADLYTRAEGSAMTLTALVKGLLDPAEKATPSAADFAYAAPSNLVYDGSAKAVTVTSDREGMGEITVEYSADGGATWSAEAPRDAGTYKVRANVAEGDKYVAQVVTDDAWVFTIAKADQAAPAGVTATDETAAGKNDGKISGVDDTMEYRKDGDASYTAITGTELSNLAPGTYYVRVKGDGNHNPSADAEVVIASGKLMPSASDFNFAAPSDLTYDGSAKEVTVTSDREGMGAITVEYSADGGATWTTEAPKDAGTYQVRVNVAEGDKYAAQTVTDDAWTFTVAKAPAAFSTAPTANALTYAGAAQALVTAGSTSDGTVQYRLGEDGAYGTAIPQATDAGAYKVYYRIVGDANHTDLAEASVEVAVAKRQLTVTGTAVADKDYDGTASAQVTVGSVQGAVPGDDVTVTATASFDDPNSGAGKPVTVTYAVSGAKAQNYIAPAQETKTASIIGIATQVSGTTVAGKTYDGTANVANENVTIGTLQDSSGAPIADGSVTLSVESATYDSADAGTRTVTVRYKLEGSGAGRYSAPDDQTIGGVAISQREATISWSGTSFTYNGKEQAPEASVSNRVGTDDVTVAVTGGQTNANPGSACIATADSLSGADAANYRLPDTKPTHYFSIRQKEITVTPAADKTKAYDGTGTVSGLAYTSAGAVEGETAAFTGALALETKGSYDVGTYKVKAGTLALANGTGDNKFKATNYTLTVDETVDFTITPREVTLDWSNDSLTYNGSEQAPIATVNNKVGSDVVTVGVTGGKTNAGTYTATADSLDGAAVSNYKLPTIKPTHNFTIAPLEATISWSDTSLTYNESEQKPTATVGNAVASDDVTVTVTGGQTDAGTYTATADSLGGAAAANYKLPTTKPTQSFTINKANQNLTCTSSITVAKGNSYEVRVNGSKGTVLQPDSSNLNVAYATTIHNTDAIFVKVRGDGVGTARITVTAQATKNYNEAVAYIDVTVTAI